MQHTAHRHSPTDDAGPSRLQASRVNFAHPRRNVAALGLQTGMSVADFGAGSGAYTLAIAERLEGTGRVFAIDGQRALQRWPTVPLISFSFPTCCSRCPTRSSSFARRAAS